MERQRRWDIDERYTGVSDAAAMLPAVHQLEEAMRGEGWVTDARRPAGGVQVARASHPDDRHGVASASVGGILAARIAG